MQPVVHVQDLHKRYRGVEAVAGVSFDVNPGEIFGILGPNGAGKTTTLEIIEGLRRADSGAAMVGGIDVARNPRAVKSIIGVHLQEAGFFDRLTVRETIELFAAFHRRRVSTESLLQRLDLDEKRGALVETLSGGQQQRLSLAIALVNAPQVLFLDEPTTGLDPQARRHLWTTIEEIRADGRTIVLTTHYMEEAQRLCDRVAIMDHGRILAHGTPRELIARHAGTSRLVLTGASTPVDLSGLSGVEDVTTHNGDLTVRSRDPLGTLHALVALQREGQLAYHGLRLEEPTLEDAFLGLTGRGLRDGGRRRIGARREE